MTHIDDVRADLDAFYLAENEVPDELLDLDDAPPAVITDPAAANRLLRAVAIIDRHVAAVQRVVNDETARLKRFAEDRTAGELRRREWLVRSLEAWMHGQPGDVRTIKLPNGELRRRALRQRVVVTDDTDPAIAETAAAAPSVIKTVRTVSRETVTRDLVPGPAVIGAASDPGYTVCEALRVDKATGEVTVVPHVVFLVPDGSVDRFEFVAG